MRWADEMRAAALRLFVAGLGGFVLAGVSFVTVGSLHVNRALSVVFAAVDPGCQIVDDANGKLLNTPWHSYTTAIEGPPDAHQGSVESIFVDGVTYTQVDGTWLAVPIVARPLKGNATANNGNKYPKRICTHVRDESVNGDKTAVYRIRLKDDQGSVYFLMWISNSRGLISRIEYYPVKRRGDKSHISIRYDYNNVQKPQF